MAENQLQAGCALSPNCPECAAKELELAKTKAENERMREERAELYSKNRRLRVQTETYKAQTREGWQTIQELQDEIDSLPIPTDLLIVEQEKTRLQEELKEAQGIIQSLPTKQAHNERQEEIHRLRKLLKAQQHRDRMLEDAMSSKKKLQAKIERQEAELFDLRTGQNTAKESMSKKVSRMKDEMEKVQNRLDVSRARQYDQERKHREQLDAKSYEISELRANLNDMDLAVERLERSLESEKRNHAVTKTHLDQSSREYRCLASKEGMLSTRNEELSQQLAEAEDKLKLAEYPLRCFAKIRRRLLYQGQVGNYQIKSDGNRMAHDGNMRADTALSLLGHLPHDINRLRTGYGDNFMTGVTSSADLIHIRHSGLQQEIKNLHASMAFEDTGEGGICTAEHQEEFKELEEMCKEEWTKLLALDVTEEVRHSIFNADETVQGYVAQIREIRKKAAVKMGKRVAYE